jgi:purine-binding chemotaxis protein CheW
MDILAARKKAAEQAKAARDARDAAAGVPEPQDRSAEPAVPERLPAPSAAGGPEPVAVQDFTAGTQQTGDAEAAPAEDSERTLEMLAFLLGSEEYVLPVDQVREVLTPREITPVPHTPDHLLGVCSVRGAVLPVMDLARRLGFGAAARDEKARIIVTGPDPDDRIGLLVDRVRSVVRFPASAVRPVPDTVERGGELLQGIIRSDHRLFILLDLEKATGSG